MSASGATEVSLRPRMRAARLSGLLKGGSDRAGRGGIQTSVSALEPLQQAVEFVEAGVADGDLALAGRRMLDRDRGAQVVAQFLLQPLDVRVLALGRLLVRAARV